MTDRDESSLFARYLLGECADERSLELYERAVRVRRVAARDAAVRFVFKHPWAIGAVDAYLARAKPNSALRQRLYLMSAILETQPRYADRFLCTDRSPLYVLAALYFAVRAACKIAAGFAIAPFIR